MKYKYTSQCLVYDRPFKGVPVQSVRIKKYGIPS